MTNSLKRWLGLPKLLSVDCLFWRSSKLQLPYTAYHSKAPKAKKQDLLHESIDTCVSNYGIMVDGGRKANTAPDDGMT